MIHFKYDYCSNFQTNVHNNKISAGNHLEIAASSLSLGADFQSLLLHKIKCIEKCEPFRKLLYPASTSRRVTKPSAVIETSSNFVAPFLWTDLKVKGQSNFHLYFFWDIFSFQARKWYRSSVAILFIPLQFEQCFWWDLCGAKVVFPRASCLLLISPTKYSFVPFSRMW